MTPLSWASFNGNGQLVKILLSEHSAASAYHKVEVIDDQEEEEEDK